MEEITEEHTVQEGKETDGTEGHRIEGRIEKNIERYQWFDWYIV